MRFRRNGRKGKAWGHYSELNNKRSERRVGIWKGRVGGVRGSRQCEVKRK